MPPAKVLRADDLRGREPERLLEGITHLLVTGSEASITLDNPWEPSSMLLLRVAARRGVAILGSCYGHQLVAKTFVGRHAVRASATPEFGFVMVDVVADDPLLARVGGAFPSFSSHGDEVVAVGPPVIPLARTADCAVQAMRLEGSRIWGLQAHPEIGWAEGWYLLGAFGIPHDEVRLGLDDGQGDEHALARVIRKILGAFLAS